ncbi:Six-hairpin glycosidase [Massarina eburnea CBS 473.64]|uniref:Six-hairpin glycosidase n=1 Tax=Massarina eburnea CBS 473.64 TaxID=1395130 RepID=A0A6A6RW13_9PLEO|nr:Six-hairpin glycosidase [Massarina eburnea CBS 473.64]
MRYNNALLSLVPLLPSSSPPASHVAAPANSPTASTASSSHVYADNAHTAVNVLQDKYYNTATGLWKGETHDLWWESGNLLETIARYGQVDESFKPTAVNIIENTFSKAPNQQGAKNWLNEFYDDMGWWALGWIASYDLTGDAKYLDTAKYIFEDMTGGWTTPCGGGIWWDKSKTSVNAIANELFISVAAHLANRVPPAESINYMNWAEADWEWFWRSGMINSDWLINDGLDLTTCKNNGKWTFTYNQGVILGGLSELSIARHDGGYIDVANELIAGSFSKLAPDGILTEPVEGDLGEQGAMFKGAYIRGLATLNSQIHSPEYTDFFKKNAESLWSNAVNADGVIEDRWQGGSSEVSFPSHGAGLDVLVAAGAAALF